MAHFHTSWLGLAVGLFVVQASAKDLSLIMWDSPQCKPLTGAERSNILQIPRNNDALDASIGCRTITTNMFNGWDKEPQDQGVIAYINTEPLANGCSLIFHKPGPRHELPPEQINKSPCWKPYRKISNLSSCARVTVDAKEMLISVCCGKSCYVPRNATEADNPIFPKPPTPDKILSRQMQIKPAQTVKPGPRSLPPHGPRNVETNLNLNNNMSKKRAEDNIDLSKCQFKRSTELVTTYLSEVMVNTPLTCATGVGAESCKWGVEFSADVQLTSSTSLSFSYAIQAGMEGVFSQTATFGWEGSASIAHGQAITHTFDLSLPPGRSGYPAFKQAFRCEYGTGDAHLLGLKETDIVSLPRFQRHVDRMRCHRGYVTARSSVLPTGHGSRYSKWRKRGR